MATLSITTPDKFRVIYPWMPKKSIYSGDIKREGYWTPSGFTESDALVTDRNSKIFLPDVDGVYQEVDQDKLSRTNRGLYANGQFTQHIFKNGFEDWPSSGPLVSGNQGSGGVSYATGVAGEVVGRGTIDGWGYIDLRFYGNRVGAALTLSLNRSGLSPAAAQGQVWTFQTNLELVGGSLTNVTVARLLIQEYENFAYRADTAVQTVVPVAAMARYSVTGTISHASTTNARAIFTINGGGAFDVTLRFWMPQFIQTPAPVPFFIPTPTNDPGILFASDIRAVQGVRPSNGDPEPLPDWEAAGLDEGVTILLDFESRARQGSTREVLRLANAQNSTLFTMQIVSGSTALRFTTVSGIDYFPGTQTGRIRAACRMMPDGTFALAREGQGSVTTGTKASPINLASAGLLTIGNRPGGGIGAWNDWIYALHICKPLSDQEMIDWVNGVIPAIPTLNNIPLSTNTKPIISGTCDFNTTKIYVYVDGIQAGTALGDESDTWRCKLSLAPGTYQITARSESTIGKFSDYSDPITLVIADELSISGTPETYVQEGMEYSFTPTTTGGLPPYAYTLEDMNTMPDGMSIDPNTGELSGYPNPGIYEGIVIQVEDQE